MQPWENFSQWEMAWTSFDYPSPLYRISNTGGNNYDKKIHPTQKPIELYSRVLNDFAEDGDRVLDTHLGSASSAIAAHEYGYNFVGCEISEAMFYKASKRYKKLTAQTKIFR